MKKGMKLLIGYDGSACADAALEDLKKAGLPRRCDVSVISAVDIFLSSGRATWMSESVKETVKHYRAEAKALMRQAEMNGKQAQKKIRAQFPGWKVRYKAVADSPAWALVKEAESWKSDLVVVGAHGHSNLGRFLGSVSQMVLTQADRSVRVGRPSANPMERPPRVLIGIDGSPDSAAAVRAAIGRSWSSATEFKLVSVIDPKKSTFVDRVTTNYMRWVIGEDFNEWDTVDRMLESHAKKLREKHTHVSYQVKKGDPKHVLVKEAESWKADCIFVGARGLSHLKRLFMGGVSTAIAARADCSVEVIRG